MKKPDGFLLIVLLVITAGCKRTDNNITTKQDSTATPPGAVPVRNPTPPGTVPVRNPMPPKGACGVTLEKAFFGNIGIQIDTAILAYYPLPQKESYYRLSLVSYDSNGKDDTTVNVQWGQSTAGYVKYKFVTNDEFNLQHENNASLTFKVESNSSSPNYLMTGTKTGGNDYLSVVQTSSYFAICTVTDSTEIIRSNGLNDAFRAPVSFDRTIGK